MTSQGLQATMLISAAALLGAGWGMTRLHSHQTPGWAGFASMVERSSPLRLAGVWRAPDTVPVAAPLVELDVPLNSWVRQGQPIGMSQSGTTPDPALMQEARLRLSEAGDAVAEARRQVQVVESAIATEEGAAADPVSRLVQAENSAAAMEAASAGSDELYRAGLEDGLDHDRAVAHREAAQHREDTLLERSVVPAGGADGLMAARSAAREQSRKAAAEQSAAQAALERLENTAGLAPVQAPADGFLVIRDENTGTYEIALGGRPRVAVQAPAAERALIRQDQPAIIFSQARPNLALHAVVESIGEARDNESGVEVCPVTLVVTDPGAALPDDARVTVTLPARGR